MMEEMMINCMGGFGMGIMMLIPLTLLIWFFLFSILVLVKLNRISEKLDKR